MFIILHQWPPVITQSFSLVVNFLYCLAELLLFFDSDDVLASVLLPLSNSASMAKLLKICSRVVWMTEYSLML